MVKLLVHVVAVPDVVLRCVVARFATPTCHAETPSQYLLSLARCRVTVAVLAARPTPPALSAALPVKVAGTVAPRYVVAVGEVTDAVAGFVRSRVNVVADDVAVMPAKSVALAMTV